MLYPRIPHLHGSAVREGDLQLSDEETARVLQRAVRVYEKLDGLNVGFRFRGPGRLAILSRVHGELAPHDVGPELATLVSWAMRRLPRLWMLCEGTKRVAFGEWLGHRIGVHYRALPDLVLFFDVADARGRFVERVDMERRVRAAGLLPNPVVFSGRVRAPLERLGGKPPFGAAEREGFVLTRGQERWKYVLQSHVRLRGRELGRALNRTEGPGAPCEV